MTADEFRTQQAGSVETIEVNRPPRDVVATFRDRAPACLQDVRTTNVMGSFRRQVTTSYLYHETLVATDKSAELIVQVTPAGVPVFERPEHGVYALIARAVPIDGRRSRLEIYGSWGLLWEEGTLKTAIQGWAAGTFPGCPELP